MKTATKKNGTRASRTSIAKALPERPQEHSDMKEIDIDLIDLSPLNYRKYYDLKAMDEFARELSQHGIISPVTVREVKAGRYELVVGERRYRASKIAMLPSMPARIRDLTDEQVIEIQLAENIQREDPHPLHEAQAIAQLQKFGYGNEEIAVKLGRSKNFIYSRIKLSGLIENLQLLFLSNRCNLQDAIAISELAPSAQQELFDEHCTDWEQENFRLGNVRAILDKFRYDLINAPFDTSSTELVPEAGACTNCPFNSAVIGSLFPDMEKKAICTNRSCYQQKCTAQFTLAIEQVVAQNKIEAIVHKSISQTQSEIIAQLPSTMELPQHNWYSVNRMEEPSAPSAEDFYTGGEDDDENDEEYEEYEVAADSEQKQFDEEAYNEAVYEYQQELAEYQQTMASGEVRIALAISGYTVTTLLFSEYNSSGYDTDRKQGVTAKDVQIAIKQGTVTPELINGEIARLQQREQRAREIDRDKVQLKLHEQFTARYQELENNTGLTQADMSAARLIIYESLDYSPRNKFRSIIFPDHEDSVLNEREMMYEVLCNMSEQKFAFLIRMALASKAQSKFPRSEEAFMLYKVAENAGLDVAAIETGQQTIAKERGERVEAKVVLLEKQLQKISSTVILEVE